MVLEMADGKTKSTNGFKTQRKSKDQWEKRNAVKSKKKSSSSSSSKQEPSSAIPKR